MGGNERGGASREANLQLADYFNEGYLELTQLFSLAHQIHEIHKMLPQSMLEIGIGNGFTSDFFRKAGIPVTTADINSNLKPDIVASLAELPGRMSSREVDLVVCCEVLEHMPFQDFVPNVRILRSLGKRLFLTLPNYRKRFGVGGILRFPKMRPFLFNWGIDLALGKGLPDQHFWEVGFSAETRRSAIEDILRREYRGVTSGRFATNPYHVYFVCE
jgi:hypothetical protein